MGTFMAVCTFRQGTVMAEVFAVVAEEQAQVAALREAGRIGEIYLSLARGTVFIETMAEGVDEASATVHTLPMAAWWDVDIFPIAAPVAPGSES